MLRTKINEYGRSVWEIILVIVIMVILSLGSLLIYKYATGVYVANSVYEDLMIQAESLRNRQKSTNRNTYDSSLGLRTRMNLRMVSCPDKENQHTSPCPKADSDTFEITVFDIADWACVRLKEKEWSPDKVAAVGISGTWYAPWAIQCNGEDSFDLSVLFWSRNSTSRYCTDGCLSCQKCLGEFCVDDCERADQVCIKTGKNAEGICVDCPSPTGTYCGVDEEDEPPLNRDAHGCRKKSYQPCSQMQKCVNHECVDCHQDPQSEGASCSDQCPNECEEGLVCSDSVCQKPDPCTEKDCGTDCCVVEDGEAVCQACACCASANCDLSYQKCVSQDNGATCSCEADCPVDLPGTYGAQCDDFCGCTNGYVCREYNMCLCPSSVPLRKVGHPCSVNCDCSSANVFVCSNGSCTCPSKLPEGGSCSPECGCADVQGKKQGCIMEGYYRCRICPDGGAKSYSGCDKRCPNPCVSGSECVDPDENGVLTCCPTTLPTANQSCSPECGCAAGSGDCIDRKCTCPKGTIRSGGQCIPCWQRTISEYGYCGQCPDSCVAGTQCSGNNYCCSINLPDQEGDACSTNCGCGGSLKCQFLNPEYKCCPTDLPDHEGDACTVCGCAEGFTCKKNICCPSQLPYSIGATCTTACGCGWALECSNNKCVCPEKKPGNQNDTCNEYCGGCDNGLVCGLGSRCHCPNPLPSSEGAACSPTCGCSDGMTCSNNKCTACPTKPGTVNASCTVSCGCDNGLVCGSGSKCQCPSLKPDTVGAACTASCGCGTGLTCSNNKCACPTNLPTLNQSCSAECGCATGECVNGVCSCPTNLPTLGQSCSSGCGCATGECVNGICQCPTNVAQNEVCNMQCPNSCVSGSQCIDPDNNGEYNCCPTSLPTLNQSCSSGCGCATGECVNGTCSCPTTPATLNSVCYPLCPNPCARRTQCIDPDNNGEYNCCSTSLPTLNQSCLSSCGCEVGECIDGTCQVSYCEGQIYGAGFTKCSDTFTGGCYTMIGDTKIQMDYLELTSNLDLSKCDLNISQRIAITSGAELKVRDLTVDISGRGSSSTPIYIWKGTLSANNLTLTASDSNYGQMDISNGKVTISNKMELNNAFVWAENSSELNVSGKFDVSMTEDGMFNHGYVYCDAGSEITSGSMTIDYNNTNVPGSYGFDGACYLTVKGDLTSNTDLLFNGGVKVTGQLKQTSYSVSNMENMVRIGDVGTKAPLSIVDNGMSVNGQLQMYSDLKITEGSLSVGGEINYLKSACIHVQKGTVNANTIQCKTNNGKINAQSVIPTESECDSCTL